MTVNIGAELLAFQVSSGLPITQKPKVVQDSPTDDYILCGDCEQFFAVLETIACNTFSNWRHCVEKGLFTQIDSNKGYSIVNCVSVNKEVIWLFLYSIFWRSSISRNAVFNMVQIPKRFEEQLRQTLLRYHAKKISEFNILIKENPSFKLLPITIVTAENFLDVTANILVALPFPGGHFLIIDQFSIILFEDVESVPPNFFPSNTSADACQMTILSTIDWQKYIVETATSVVAAKMAASTE